MRHYNKMHFSGHLRPRPGFRGNAPFQLWAMICKVFILGASNGGWAWSDREIVRAVIASFVQFVGSRVVPQLRRGGDGSMLSRLWRGVDVPKRNYLYNVTHFIFHRRANLKRMNCAADARVFPARAAPGLCGQRLDWAQVHHSCGSGRPVARPAG